MMTFKPKINGRIYKLPTRYIHSPFKRLNIQDLEMYKHWGQVEVLYNSLICWLYNITILELMKKYIELKCSQSEMKLETLKT